MDKLRYFIITLLLVGAMSACGSSEESAARFIESGKELVKEGEIDKARLEFKNAIQIDPTQAEPYYQLALMDEKAQKWKSLFANLTTVEQLDPTHYDAIAKLGQINLLSGKFDIALEKADKVLLADGQHIQAMILRASVFLKQKNFGMTLTEIDNVLKLEPNNLEAMSVKIITYKEQGNTDKALNLIEQALSIHQNALPVTMIKLSILEDQKNYPAMEDVYRSLLTQYPDEKWVIASLAKLLNNGLDRYEDAKKALQEFIAANPEDAKSKLLLVSLVKTKDPQQAINILDDFSKADPENYDLRFAKIDLLSKQKDQQSIVADLQQIVTDDPEGNHGRKAKIILASMEAGKGNFEQAETMTNQVLEASPEDEAALLLKAKLDLKNNNIDTAVTNLRVVLRNNPESDKALVLLAQAYMKSGSEELAEDNFRQALTVNPENSIAALSVANTMVKSNDLERTEDVLVKALRGSPDDKSLLQALAQVRILKKDWVTSTESIELLQNNDKDSAFPHYLLGQVNQGQGEYALAIEDYTIALTKNPQMNRALQGLASSYINLDKKQALIGYLNQFVSTNPKQFFAYSMLSNIYRQDKDFDSALSIVEKGLTVESRWVRGHSSLATINLARGDNKKAIASCEEGLIHNPDSKILAMQLASIHELVGDFESAKQIYEKLLAKDENLEPAINNLASLLTDNFESEQNLQKALALSSRFKDSTQTYYLDTYAWVNVKLGNLEIAQPVLEKVVSLSPDMAVFNYHLGILYSKQDNKTGAVKYLDIAKRLADEQGDEKLGLKVGEALASL